MNRRASVIGILVLLLFSSMAMGIHGASVHKNMIVRKSSNLYQVVEINGVKYTTHDVIRINSNADFNSTNGVVSGSGTQSNPYIISGWDIDAHGTKNAIYIGNTTSYFVVENSHLYNTTWGSNQYFIGVGINLYNVTNGILENNTCNNNSFYGIFLSSSSNNTILNNNCSDNWDGIYLANSSNNTILNNNCTHNNDGIILDSSSNNTILNNNCTHNNDGIALWASRSNVISNNTCINNIYEGIGLWENPDNNNTISNNIFVNNGEYGIYIASGSKNHIYSNTFFYNQGSGDTYDSAHIQACDYGKNNSWNSSTGGNYWRGWANNNNTNDKNHDGIVDWAYKIYGSAEAKDYYPLKNTSIKLAPLAPRNLNVTTGNGYVNLTWNTPRGNGTSPIIYYRIYRNGALIATTPTSQLYYNDTNVINGQNYTYYVTAVNSVGESEHSNEVQATPGQAVPELQAFWLPVIVLLLLLGILRNREKKRN